MLHPLIADPSATRHVLKKFHLRAVKGLGQNFLIDANVVRQIVEAADICAGDEVLEIGPGIGTLTQGLLEAGARVTAVEVDKKLPAVLNETLAGYENFRLIAGDILKLNVAEIMPRPFKVVANLPYYITTQILLTLLEKNLPVTKIVTMVQREVAERMTAAPGSKIYGALSVAVQLRSEASIAFEVPPKSFLPPPEVTSAVVVCNVRKLFDVDEEFFTRVVRSAFAQRRKTLANSLAGAGFSREKISAALTATGIDGSRRAETLSLAEFAELSTALRQ
ncbi:MAG: 16S rRNA (adenine(1518)-N(6)/adenine(1519)-N(6))-dimethyltransferase RsmA [Quinella sp. 2Q5]|nr:16S rRNA (adenine(1518)-N(6)/adenine(1519)-N(6))-dimethyltransferase RsmA [Quinella sp. 2Q5]